MSIKSVMLAASEIPDPNDLSYPMMFSLKYDGVRTYIDDHNAFSRKCELWPNAYLQKWVYDRYQWLNGLDGELIVGPPNAKDVFQRTMSGITSQDGIPDFRFYVFDLIDKPDCDAAKRDKLLALKLSLMPPEVRSSIVHVRQHRITNPVFLHEMYMDAINKGYEGLIGKRESGHYKEGRSTLKEALLLKFKEFEDSEIRITSVKQGKSNQNEDVRDKLGKAKRSSAKAGKVDVETIGSFIGVDVNPKSPFYGKTVTVGPGDYKKDVLAQMYADGMKDPTTLIGKFMTYKYQVAGVKDLPRYPGSRSAKGLRDTKDF